LKIDSHTDADGWEFINGGPTVVTSNWKLTCTDNSGTKVGLTAVTVQNHMHNNPAVYTELLMRAIGDACFSSNAESVLAKYMQLGKENRHAKFNPTRMMSPFGCTRKLIDRAITDCNGEIICRIKINLFNDAATGECMEAIKAMTVVIQNWNLLHHNLHMTQDGAIVKSCGIPDMDMCFMGRGLASCYQGKAACTESGCQSQVAACIKQKAISQEIIAIQGANKRKGS
jgi:hypothetical protein